MFGKLEQSIVFPKANLSLLSEVLPTTKHAIVADSTDGYHAIRSVFASKMGLGMRNRHSPMSAIKDPSKIPNTLQSTDTINMCDVEVSNYPECHQMKELKGSIITAYPF